jgi:hypothetical protein
VAALGHLAGRGGGTDVRLSNAGWGETDWLASRLVVGGGGHRHWRESTPARCRSRFGRRERHHPFHRHWRNTKALIFIPLEPFNLVLTETEMILRVWSFGLVLPQRASSSFQTAALTQPQSATVDSASKTNSSMVASSKRAMVTLGFLESCGTFPLVRRDHEETRIETNENLQFDFCLKRKR